MKDKEYIFILSDYRKVYVPVIGEYDKEKLEQIREDIEQKEKLEVLFIDYTVHVWVDPEWMSKSKKED